jgi:hypothetical protein
MADDRNALGQRTFKVDYVYDTEWDCTYPWSERAELVEDRDDPTTPRMVKSLIQGPDLYVIAIPISYDPEEDDFDEWEDQFFLSEDEAKAALETAQEKLRSAVEPEAWVGERATRGMKGPIEG